jgi:hypothetical protein
MALSVVGRPRDRASHVLVSPPEYEDHPEFFHPDQGGLIHAKADLRERPMPAPTLDPSRASVALIPTPHILARYPIRDPQALATRGLVDLVNQTNLVRTLEDEPSLFVDPAANRIVLCGVEARLGPKLFALFRLMAEARRGGWGLADEGGLGGGLSFAFIAEEKDADGTALGERFETCLVEAIEAAGGDASDPDNPLLKPFRTSLRSPDRVKELSDQLGPNLTSLRRELEEAFGAPVVDMLLPRRRGRFGLSIPTQAISIG